MEEKVERVEGIEPSWPAWKAGTLPLSYTRGTEVKLSTKYPFGQSKKGSDFLRKSGLLDNDLGFRLKKRARYFFAGSRFVIPAPTRFSASIYS